MTTPSFLSKGTPSYTCGDICKSSLPTAASGREKSPASVGMTGLGERRGGARADVTHLRRWEYLLVCLSRRLRGWANVWRASGAGMARPFGCAQGKRARRYTARRAQHAAHYKEEERSRSLGFARDDRFGEERVKRKDYFFDAGFGGPEGATSPD